MSQQINVSSSMSTDVSVESSSTTQLVVSGSQNTVAVTIEPASNITVTMSRAVVAGGGNIGTSVSWANVTDKNGANGPDYISIGQNAGGVPGYNSIALGTTTANLNQGPAAIAIGPSAGRDNQRYEAIAIGEAAGLIDQKTAAIAIGASAGSLTQNNNAISIGIAAGYTNQGSNSIAIGANAGINNQSNNSIILNATGANLNQTTANTFTVKPVRNALTSNVMFYNNTTGEITYDLASNTIVGNANYANFAGTAFSVAGANVTGTVANANYAAYAGNVTVNAQPNITSVGTLTGLSIAGNIIPTSNITYDLGNNTNRFNDLYLSGNTIYIAEQEISANANGISFTGNIYGNANGLNYINGANVIGTVANANYSIYSNVANTANSVAGANVTGEVSYAAVANSVALANVSGAGNIASINLDGNVSNLLTGAGTFVTIPSGGSNANYANFAGQVVDATQSNITSVGTLTSLAVSGNITGAGNLKIGNILLTEFSSTLSPTNSLQVITDTANANNRSLSIDGGTVTSLANVDAGTTIAAGTLVMRGGTMGSDANRITSNTQSIQGGSVNINAGFSYGANNQTRSVTGGGITFNAGRGVSANANAISGGPFSATAGGVRWQVSNVVTGGSLSLGAGAITPDLGLSSFSANTVNIGGTSFTFGTFGITTSNGVVGTIRTPLVNFGASQGQGTTISNGVSNITIGNIIAADQVYFRTPGIGGTAGISQGNINNVVIGNITTPALRFETGSWQYPGGSNVSNVSVTGNYTSGDILVLTGAVNNAASVLGTITRGNVRLNGKNIVLEASNTSNSSGTGLFVFDANNTANLGNLVTANFFTGTLTTNAQPNITSVGTLTSLDVSGNATIGNITNVDSITFDTANIGPGAVAQFTWNDGQGTLDLGLKGGNVTATIGQQQYARVYNAEANSLSKGEVVYVSGAQGNLIKVNRAQANTEATSVGTLGFVAEVITAGGEGFIQTSGAMYKLNTNTLTAGNTIYLSPSIPGAYTQTKPVAPDQLVTLGYVERVSATVGSIYVKVDNGYELDELHNVLITSPTAGQSLIYNGSNIWVNGSPNIANISNGNSNVNIPTSNGNINFTAVGNTNMVITGTGVNVAGSLSIIGVSNLGSNSNVIITGGTAGYVLSTNGSGNLSWVAQSGGGGSTDVDFTPSFLLGGM